MQTLIILMAALALTGCFNKQAYERIENSYLPHPQPMSSKVKVICDDNPEIFEPGGFSLIYGALAPLDSPYSKDHCFPFTHPGIIREKDKLPITTDMQTRYNVIEIKPFPSPKHIPNIDPEKGAVYVWKTYAGITRLDGLIFYQLVLYEGDKPPLGSWTEVLSSPNQSLFVEHKKLMIHGQEWDFVSTQPHEPVDSNIWGVSIKAGEIANVMDFYRAKVGNHTILVYGYFPGPIPHFPEWFNPRRALLREWVETFKIMPLPADYVLPSKEEIQKLREDEIQRWKDSEANPAPRPVKIDPEQARRNLSAPMR